MGNLVSNAYIEDIWGNVEAFYGSRSDRTQHQLSSLYEKQRKPTITDNCCSLRKLVLF